MKSLFPWRLFWKFFGAIVSLFLLIFFLTFALSLFFLDLHLSATESVVLFIFYAVLSVVGGLIFSYQFSHPVRRLIHKALRIANKKQYSTEEPSDDVLEEEPGEYFELEMALNKIRRKLKKRRIQLAHEREEARALMSSLDDAILTVTPELRVRFFNSRFANQFLERGKARSLSAGEVVPLAQIFRVPEVLDLFQKAIQSGESQGRTLKLDSLIDEEKRFFSVKVSPLREEKSLRLYGAMALFHDITEVKKADQIRIEFVENASHELRTPLTSLKGFVDTAKEDLQAGRTDQLTHFLNVISKNVDRLSELVGDMLTLSSLESGASLKKELVHPDELTREVVEQLSGMAKEKSIQIQVDSQVNELLADSGKVEQVLMNLVGNAIKYVQAGGHVQIRWEEDAETVRLRVIDNGPGIADIHLKRLFERFYRIDKGRSRDVGGTGLGLSIVKHILQSHGGTVQVKSELGRGSEFICLFPK